EITQRILDRIMFMRSCEDRNLIHRRSLKELFEERADTVGMNTMLFLGEEFKHYNIIFDSDLFRPQNWETNLAIDFKVMKDIILDTYNPYQFDVIPLEVLGNIYEQYLGYTIRLTEHQVKYELKPDVRKAGGVYYTPEYIVDYIVKNTVRKLLQELSAKKIKKLRILDPACGSGSFLIRAYEEMLSYYRNQKKRKIPSPLKGEGKGEGDTPTKLSTQQLIKHEEQEPILTIEEKSQILREHIFGVDIDEQAVEVTKLSLMLKMLEGEFGIIPGRNILPMLDKNIRCGNSLISGDTLELKKYFGDDWYRVQPFNWKDEFRKIMIDEGGFDVVIGNPPYGAELYSEDYMKNMYLFSSAMKEINSYLYFTEKAYELLKDNGNFGFIIPDTFLLKLQYENFRKFLIEKITLYEITETGVVFEQSKATPNVLLFFKKSLPKPESKFRRKQLNYQKSIANVLEDLKKDNWYNTGELNYKSWQKSFCLQLGKYLDDERQNIIHKISVNNNKIIPLQRLRNIEVDRGLEGSKSALLAGSRKSGQRILIPDNVSRYCISDNPTLFVSGYKKSFGYDRILIIRIRNIKIADRIIAAFENQKRATLKTLQQIFYISKSKISLKYILGILNSTMMNFYCNHILTDDINKDYLLRLPIYKIDFANPKEDQFHNNLVALVDVMLDLNKKVQTARGGRKEQIQRQMEKTDKEIDDLVYRLYGITDEERKIIEG
ncbi:MAG: N-6 DNA methylase, partial [bacterium]